MRDQEAPAGFRRRTIPLLAFALAALVGGPAMAASSPARVLLLPYFEVDTADPNGTTTLWAVRNDGSEPVTLTATYFETDRMTPQHSDEYVLGAKRIRTVDIRALVANLDVDPDGVARGWVRLELDEGTATGDFFLVTPNEAFASGDRLVDIDPDGTDFELCTNWVLRFLNGGGFSGGTSLFFWLDTETIPTGEEPIATYSVYSESGNLVFTNSLYNDQRAFRVPASQLITPFATQFGALEIQFADGMLGHVSEVLDALGVFSVGITATCRD